MSRITGYVAGRSKVMQSCGKGSWRAHSLLMTGVRRVRSPMSCGPAAWLLRHRKGTSPLGTAIRFGPRSVMLMESTVNSAGGGQNTLHRATVNLGRRPRSHNL